MSEKNKEFYLDSISVGSLIAFKDSDRMLTGKVIKFDGETYATQTKNGSVYFVSRSDVVWVKNGSHWPKGIYNALKLADKFSPKEGE